MPSDEVSLDQQGVQLWPGLADLRKELKISGKRLMKTEGGKNAFDNPQQLRLYIGTHLMPHLDKLLVMLGGLSQETYALAASNAAELRRLHAFTVDELNRMGADLDEDAPMPGVHPEILDHFQQCFYALGTAIQEEVPGNERLEQAYNKCAEAISEVIGDLMGNYEPEYDDEDDDDDRADDDERDDAEAEAPEETDGSGARKPNGAALDGSDG